MGDDLFDTIVATYIGDNETHYIRSLRHTMTQPTPPTVMPWVGVAQEPTPYYEPVEIVVPSEECEAYKRFIERHKKELEKERNYEQFKNFTRILEHTYDM